MHGNLALSYMRPRSSCASLGILNSSLFVVRDDNLRLNPWIGETNMCNCRFMFRSVKMDLANRQYLAMRLGDVFGQEREKRSPDPGPPSSNDPSGPSGPSGPSDIQRRG